MQEADTEIAWMEPQGCLSMFNVSSYRETVSPKKAINNQSVGRRVTHAKDGQIAQAGRTQGLALGANWHHAQTSSLWTHSFPVRCFLSNLHGKMPNLLNMHSHANLFCFVFPIWDPFLNDPGVPKSSAASETFACAKNTGFLDCWFQRGKKRCCGDTPSSKLAAETTRETTTTKTPDIYSLPFIHHAWDWL